MKSQEEILEGVKEYFSIHELVDKTTFNKHGERAWKFFDFYALWALLIIREGIGKPMTINNWKSGGRFSQRGLRTNICSIVLSKVKQMRLYLSGHVLGKGFDFDVQGMTADEVRDWILENEHLFPFKIRLEHKISKTGKTINWVHIDTIYEQKNPKVYLFNV